MTETPDGFRYRVTTLGCRVNRADSIAIARGMESAGGTQSRGETIPDVWVVNTCAVTSEAMKKSRKAVRRCAASGARVTVTGCASELEPETFEGIAGPGSVVPNCTKELIGGYPWGDIPGGLPAYPLPAGDAVRVPVKVQDGCERFCAYCIVPYLRGKPRSREFGSIVAEMHLLEESGAGEIVLCGIDLGSFRDPASGAGVAGLVEGLLEESCRMWLRLSSLELSDVTDELLCLMAERERLCAHLHLPLQSGDARVLEDMGRGYDPGDFAARVEEIRTLVPGVAITTDVMVGFPTESREAFERTVSLLSRVGFSRVHVFKYSPRRGTCAYGLGDPVDAATKETRASLLRALAAGTARRFYEGFNGRIMPVLVEATMKSEPGRIFARAQSFAGVVIEGGPELVGKFASVRIEGSGADVLKGVIVHPADSGREGEVS